MLIVLLLCLFLWKGAPLLAQSADTTVAPPIVKLSPTTYQLGNILLDIKHRQIRFPGKINMEKGVVELLACAPGGKMHESVLVVDIVPHHLQVSLLLLGLNYGDNLQYQGDPNMPKGDSVEVWVSWQKDNTDHIVRGEDLIFDLVSKKSMNHTHWIFSGSRIVNDAYMADVEGSIITTYHDPFTILDNPLPGGGNDELYVVNQNLVPPKGTPVEVTIKAISKNKNE
jgi:hypothetical protein